MKGSICTVIGAIGGGIAALFGGWDSALVTLIIFMGIDFATGMMILSIILDTILKKLKAEPE